MLLPETDFALWGIGQPKTIYWKYRIRDMALSLPWTYKVKGAVLKLMLKALLLHVSLTVIVGRKSLVRRDFLH